MEELNEKTPAPSTHLRGDPVAWRVTRYDNKGAWLDTTLHIRKPEIGSTSRTDIEPLYLGQEARRAVAMDAAMTEAYCASDDDLTDCFRHHITTTIGWLAFGARPGPEMQMYEEGFKAGYRRCQSDNEPDLGEEEDALSDRARKLVRKLRQSIKSGAVQLSDVEDAIDLVIDQSSFPLPQPREAV